MCYCNFEITSLKYYKNLIPQHVRWKKYWQRQILSHSGNSWWLHLVRREPNLLLLQFFPLRKRKRLKYFLRVLHFHGTSFQRTLKIMETRSWPPLQTLRFQSISIHEPPRDLAPSPSHHKPSRIQKTRSIHLQPILRWGVRHPNETRHQEEVWRCHPQNTKCICKSSLHRLLYDVKLNLVANVPNSQHHQIQRHLRRQSFHSRGYQDHLKNIQTPHGGHRKVQ